jgi:WD40 repeat protein
VASVEAGRVLVISTDQRLSTWDLQTGHRMLDLGTRGRAVTSGTTDPHSPEATIDPTAPWVATVAMTRDGRWAATGTSNGWIELWDLDHGELVADFRLDAPVLAVALDDDGGGVAALDESGAVIRLQRSLGLRSR